MEDANGSEIKWELEEFENPDDAFHIRSVDVVYYRVNIPRNQAKEC